MNKKISLCMIVKDEEKNLQRCLLSVQGAVDEIIIVDTGSTDHTLDTAKRFSAKVQAFPWNGNFSDARNASLELATGEWVLFLDADEALAEESGPVLRQVVADTTIDGYLIKIISYMGDESYSQWSTDMVFRLFRNRPDYRFRGAVHEQVIDCIQECNSQARFQAAPGAVILHYGYLDQQIKDKDKMNRNLAIIGREAEIHPESRSVHYHYGVELFRVGRFAEAARQLEIAAQGVDPGQLFLPKLFNYLAPCYHRSGRPEQALETIRAGLELFPDNAGLHLYGGQISYEAKDYGSAYTFFSKCLTLPEQPDYYGSFSGARGFRPSLFLALLAGKFGNEEEALRYYIHGLRDNPQFVAALDGIIRILRPREDPAYTREILEKLCEFCTPEAYLLVADILLGHCAYSLALEYYERGLSGKPEPSRNTLHRAVCLVQTEHYLEALQQLDLFTTGDPFYFLAKINTLLCFWLQGNGHIVGLLADKLFELPLSQDTAAVISLLRDTIRDKQGDPVSLGNEGIAFLLDIIMRTLAMERYRYVKRLLSQVDTACLKDYGLAVGQLWERYNQPAEAEHYVRLYLENHPNSAEAHGALAGLLKQTGSPMEASACYLQAIALDPSEPEYYRGLYELYLAMSRDSQTTAAYGAVMDADTQETENYSRQLVVLYNSLGQRVLDEVQDQFGAAAALFPSQPLPTGSICSGKE
jgi:tetratricopeptide (TPR) repeat protein